MYVLQIRYEHFVQVLILSSKLDSDFSFLIVSGSSSHVFGHCVKSVRVRSFSDLYFPSFGLNTETYFVSFRIQSESGKLRTRKTLNTDTLHAVSASKLSVSLPKLKYPHSSVLE